MIQTDHLKITQPALNELVMETLSLEVSWIPDNRMSQNFVSAEVSMKIVLIIQ
jgi:hypothetical protein